MSTIHCRAALVLLSTVSATAMAQTAKQVNIPSFPMSTTQAKAGGAGLKPEPTAAIPAGVSTELRAVLGQNGQWQLSCEEKQSSGSGSYSAWLERLSSRREVNR
jgi:hypothetical protein